METTLLVLAAGMGSRYGGLKQIDAISDDGKTILDYSIDDAIRAGFTKIVIVIRKDFSEAFDAKIGTHYKSKISIQYAYQSVDDLPQPFCAPENRSKPWGTAQAIWSARDLIHTPFAVINADDFYGRDAFKQMQRFCQSITEGANQPMLAGLATYALSNTLSKNGTVNRGVCTLNENQQLEKIEEHTQIQLIEGGSISGQNASQNLTELSPEAPVSMNFWAFSPGVLSSLEQYFAEFLKAQIQNPNSECYLPNAIDAFIQSGVLICESIKTNSQWLGITYPQDKAQVKKALAEITKTSVYFED
jgi:NDP-sugar pyrophosphorylase family protein